MRTSLLLLALAAPTLAVVTRQAEPRTAFVADVDGSYGVASFVGDDCPSTVQVSGTDGADKAVGLTPVVNIDQDGKPCSGGTMYTVSETVARSPETLRSAGLDFAVDSLRNNPSASAVIQQPLNTEVLVGFDNKPRTCGGQTWGTDTVYIFVKEGAGDQLIRIDTPSGVESATIKAGEKGMFIISPKNRLCLMTAPATVVGDVPTTGQDEEDRLAASAEALADTSPDPTDEPTSRADASPSPSEEDDGSVCFPSTATVSTPSGPKLMRHVSIGDNLHVGNGVFSPVFAFTHRDALPAHTYTRLSTASGAALTLTSSHYLYANLALVPASAVRPGDVLTLASGRTSPVVSVDRVSGHGLYNPQTVSGDIVVDGVVASTYTTAVEPALAHAALAPLRAMARAGLAMGWAVLEKGADRVGGLVTRPRVCV